MKSNSSIWVCYKKLSSFIFFPLFFSPLFFTFCLLPFCFFHFFFFLFFLLVVVVVVFWSIFESFLFIFNPCSFSVFSYGISSFFLSANLSSFLTFSLYLLLFFFFYFSFVFACTSFHLFICYLMSASS